MLLLVVAIIGGCTAPSGAAPPDGVEPPSPLPRSDFPVPVGDSFLLFSLQNATTPSGTGVISVSFGSLPKDTLVMLDVYDLDGSKLKWQATSSGPVGDPPVLSASGSGKHPMLAIVSIHTTAGGSIVAWNGPEDALNRNETGLKLVRQGDAKFSLYMARGVPGNPVREFSYNVKVVSDAAGTTPGDPGGIFSISTTHETINTTFDHAFMTAFAVAGAGQAEFTWKLGEQQKQSSSEWASAPGPTPVASVNAIGVGPGPAASAMTMRYASVIPAISFVHVSAALDLSSLGLTLDPIYQTTGLPGAPAGVARITAGSP